MQKRQYGGRVALHCEQCGAEFTRKVSRVKPHSFCSKPCYLASPVYRQAVLTANKRRSPDGGVRSLECLRCATPFMRHLSQVSERNFCSRECMRSYALENPARQITPQGYVRLWVGKGTPGADGSGHIPEHRLVMQRNLGRILLPAETVHHVNGDRADNRLENLELWSSSHPSGQRVVDKVAWAREILATYEGLPIQ